MYYYIVGTELDSEEVEVPVFSHRYRIVWRSRNSTAIIESTVYDETADEIDMEGSSIEAQNVQSHLDWWDLHPEDAPPWIEV